MQYHLVFIVLTILYFTINVQSVDNSTIVTVVQNVTKIETTVAPTTAPVVVNQTTTQVLHKSVGSSYVEPPPHPRGYCIRSRLMCSRIRRCCQGPCNVNNMKCP